MGLHLFILKVSPDKNNPPSRRKVTIDIKVSNEDETVQGPKVEGTGELGKIEFGYTGNTSKYCLINF